MLLQYEGGAGIGMILLGESYAGISGKIEKRTERAVRFRRI